MLRKSLFAAVAFAAAIMVFSVPQSQALPVAVDMVFVVDESGSMSGEHAFLKDVIDDLEAALIANNVGTSTSNQYGLVGFGSSGIAPRQINVGGGQFGSASQFKTATNSLLLNGFIEDGWAGLDFALNYSFRSNTAKQIILVTDEDRDNWDNSLTYASVLNDLTTNNVLLNAIVNNPFSAGGQAALGISGDADNTAYIADGSGGFTKVIGGIVGNGAGLTEVHYVPMAMATSVGSAFGAAWNLNFLRSGALNAESFAAAFIDIKVQEVIQQEVPEPGALLLLGTGLLGLAILKRKRI